MSTSRAIKCGMHLAHRSWCLAFCCLFLLHSRPAFAIDNEALIKEWHEQQAEKRITIDRLDFANRKVLLLGELQNRLQIEARPTRQQRFETVEEWAKTFKLCSPLVQAFFAGHALYIAGEMLPNRVKYRNLIFPVIDKQEELRIRVAKHVIQTVVEAANSSDDWLVDPQLKRLLEKLVEYKFLDNHVQIAASNAAKKQYRSPNPIYEKALKDGEEEVRQIREVRSWHPISMPCSQQSKDATARTYSLLRQKNLLEEKYADRGAEGYRPYKLQAEQRARVELILGSLRATFPKLSEEEKAYFYSRTVTLIGFLITTDIESASAPFFEQLLNAVSLDWPQYNANSIALYSSYAGYCPGRMSLAIKASKKAIQISRFAEINAFSDANWTQDLGYLHVINGDFQEAKACFERAIQVESQLPYFLDTLKDRNIARNKCWLESLSAIKNNDKCNSDVLITRHTGKTSVKP